MESPQRYFSMIASIPFPSAAAALDTHLQPALNLRTFISAGAGLQTPNRDILLNVGFSN
jgi:hypothetical protein